jgi:HPt (histidine-containing phosphotransfer) domain-containing protein
MYEEEKDRQYMYSDHFDHQFLEELYAGDTEAAAEIFQSSLTQIIDELKLAEEKALAGDFAGVRKIFHKIKPLFGYMGLLSVQDFVQHFEDQCGDSVLMSDIQIPYENIKEIIREALSLVGEEHQKLSEFNNRRA